MAEISDKSPCSIVLVMGITGVGKSTFISKLIGDDTGIGHDLTSYTQGVQFHSMEIKGRAIYLVDTPGFNDTYRSDFEIFSEIAFILSQIYRRGLKIAGILYLHRISDNRISGSTLRNFKLLETMYGMDAAHRVFLVTTMWGSSKDEQCEAALRESRLLTTRQFWGRFSEQGSQTKRWRGDEWSALSIVDALISLGDEGGYKPLLIQRELVDEGKPLKETTAGLELMSEYTIAEKGLSEEIRLLRSEESVSQHDVEAAISEITREIREMRQAQEKLKVSTRKLFIEKERSYGKVLSKIRDEQQKLSGELQEQRERYARLQNEIKSNDKLRIDEHRYWSQKRANLEDQARMGRRRRDSIEVECQKIDEEESVLNEHLIEFENENESSISQVSHDIQELRKRDVVKRNILPLLGLLAGVGLTAAGAVTGLVPLAGAGVGLTISSASEIKFSRNIRHQGPYENSHGSFVSNSSTAAFNGAQISDILLSGSK
ncbi:hypothetical protein N7478_008399 [Penicillium angulare]|uniref:uncharacterized protein n=1 Tax=Penicillium angulare TaxID=116970 RepID=UPI0025409E65|nr:uncharacterized protein N7478_008399 [Penicillium angulare]KAJ5273274.1 hypothetical protein N7478_008399 [Penicillium angulare]